MIRLLILVSLLAVPSACFADTGFVTVANRSTNCDFLVFVAKDSGGGFGPWAVRIICAPNQTVNTPLPEGKYRVQYRLSLPGTDTATVGPSEWGSAIDVGPKNTLSLYAKPTNTVDISYTVLPFVSPIFHLWAMALAVLVLLSCWLGYRLVYR